MAAWVVALAVARSAAGADAWSGRATIGYGGISAPGTSSRALQQGYEGSLRLAFTPVIDGQFQLRYDDSRSTTAGSSQLVRPSAALHYRTGGFFDLRLGYDLTYARSASSGSSDPSQRLSDNLQLVTSLSLPELPSARLAVWRQTTRALEAPGETRNTSGLLTLDYGLASIRMNQATLASLVEDTSTQVSTRTIQPRAALGFERKLGSTSTLSGSYNVAYTDVAQTSIAPLPVLSPAEHFPSGAGGGIYAVADPLLGSVAPLPALTDQETFVPITGIPLGLGAVPNENIGIDMGRLVTIDTLQLWVRTAAQTILPAGQYSPGLVTWSAYSSVNGTSWTPITTAQQPQYNASDGRLEWTSFSPTLARYFKVVNASGFGFSTTEAYATEIRAIEHILVQPGATARSSTFVQGGALSASVRPLEKLTLTGQSSVSRSSQTTPLTVFSTTGWGIGGNASAGPFQDNRVTATLGQEVRGSDTTLGGRRLGGATSASLRYLVADPLHLSLDADRTEEHGPTDSVVSIGTRFGSAVTLLPGTLAFSGSVGFDRVHTEPDDVETDRLSAAITSSARVFPSLTLSGTASVQTGEVKQPASAVLLFPQPPTAKVYSGGATYRPNERLSLGASLSYVDLPQVAGMTQQYRVAWDPFPGGSLKLGLSYDQTFDAVTGSRLSRLAVMPTWQLNRSASFSGTFSDTLHASPAPRSHLRMYFLSFTMRV